MSVDPLGLCQLEIHVSDVQKAVAFYEGAFGWKRVPAEIHEYIVLEVPQTCPFGISLVPGRVSAERASGIVPYFAVQDPAEIAAKCEEHGGAKRFGPMKLAGYGEIFQVEDPDGNRFGLYQKR